jgi:hypothetical protein
MSRSMDVLTAVKAWAVARQHGSAIHSRQLMMAKEAFENSSNAFTGEQADSEPPHKAHWP